MNANANAIVAYLFRVDHLFNERMCEEKVSTTSKSINNNDGNDQLQSVNFFKKKKKKKQ